MLEAEVLKVVDPQEYLKQLLDGKYSDYCRPDGRKSLTEEHEVQISSTNSLGGIGSAVVRIGGTVVSTVVHYEVGISEIDEEGELILSSSQLHPIAAQNALMLTRIRGTARTMATEGGIELTRTVDDTCLLVRLKLDLTVLSNDGSLLATALHSIHTALSTATVPCLTIEEGMVRTATDIDPSPLCPSMPTLSVTTKAILRPEPGKTHKVRCPCKFEEENAVAHCLKAVLGGLTVLYVAEGVAK
ncbi:3' exoribonuclease family, domain 1 [Carpediemonas membranifera]|uniref:Ribosomal RNA-processing protein 43 n=1 Tax=Carpediemonas membranifera TaxID=201153 RepID=A0A8J6B326_9EUKA|nr:3' exoribonuclease family, domain 1 [Carpediemonas membranifera]|eukprot:KAG9391889.1 3' exoribonuclease family, domain 1 [Carpediemonas membranifera]